MDWWFATLGIVCLAGASIATRSTVLSFLTLGLFLPLALHTLYQDFSRFWILMALSLAVEVAALVRYGAALARREPVRDYRLPAHDGSPSREVSAV